MDEPSVEMPELRRNLAELKEKALHICRNPTPNGQFELASIDRAVEIIIKITHAIHLHELEVGQRQLERSIALHTPREHWE